MATTIKCTHKTPHVNIGYKPNKVAIVTSTVIFLLTVLYGMFLQVQQVHHVSVKIDGQATSSSRVN